MNLPRAIIAANICVFLFFELSIVCDWFQSMPLMIGCAVAAWIVCFAACIWAAVRQFEKNSEAKKYR